MSKKPRRNFARTFGQDLMRHEHVFGPGKRTRAQNTQGWVKDKTAAGDLAGGLSANQSGTSIFDPVLCELLYRWFCPPGGTVLDPFAGGSVRGLVASRLGRSYVGVDLRPEQVAANRAQVATVCRPTDPEPAWLVGDAQEIDNLTNGVNLRADFVFSCPPYFNLERYSDDPRDLSTMSWDAFRVAYAGIIRKCLALLNPDRFAAFVVGDVRDDRGFYRAFPSLTIDAFATNGAPLYNEMILVTAAGSLPIRVRKQFEGARKIGKTHQNVLVFCNGDPRKATAAVGAVEFGEVVDEGALVPGTDALTPPAR